MIELQPWHAEAMAAIHESAFPPGERWGATALAELVATPGAFGFMDPAGGFILARHVAGEAEVLTLAVCPAARRQGLGRALLHRALSCVDAMPVFLEVAVDNLAAEALYRGVGFVECGRRPGYYSDGRDAVVMRR